MPSSRRLKVTGLIALLTVCIIFYVTNGARSTHESPFYTRTVQAINERQAAAARENIVEEERQRLERVERVQKEHDAAVSAAATAAGPAKTEATDVLGAGDVGPQKPIGPDSTSRSVAGRKLMRDGKVVHDKPAKDGDDGVAKVGNVGPQTSHEVKGKDELEEGAKVEAELNDILKKGPIIIFSKSFCPFSKKAKHILLDLYSITPPPYVVELDKHELGPGLQSALQRTTGRQTVPNILINGRSIGGGDDVESLHNEGKIESTISSMGGKRVMKVEKKPDGSDEDKRTEMRFKA